MYAGKDGGRVFWGAGTVISNRVSKPVVLQTEGLHLNFGGVAALDDVGFEAREGEIVAIIGPNGAGKTCALNCVSGFYRAQQGKIYFDNSDISSLPTHKIASLGISRTFQSIQLYTSLSAVDNLLSARHIHMKHNFAGALYFGWAHREEVEHRRAVEEIIDFLEMEHVRKKIVGSLPYGIRKRIDLGRALAQEPTLLLLDEPMAGMNVEEKEDMARFILDIREEKGVTIVLVEHDMGLVMDISDWVVVLDFGQKIAEGLPEEISLNEKVIKAYLGGGVATLKA